MRCITSLKTAVVDFIARLNPQSEIVENLEILFFSKRLEGKNPLQLPVDAALKLVI